MDLSLRLARLRHLALDLDGTIFKDRALIDGALPFLRLLDELGIGRTFVTNNSSRSLYTDIAMANAAGILSILVLTGEATAAEADSSADPPRLTIDDLVELGRLLRESRGAHP